jgi:hypothetical protein
MNSVTEHVVVVAHDDAPQHVAVLRDGVAHCSLIAFDVQLDAGWILFLDDGAVPLKAIVGDGEEASTQRV